MISKELLSEVLKEEVNKSIILEGTIIKYSYKYLGYAEINIYELGHKCKEWALQNNFKIQSGAYTVNTGKIPEFGGYEATIYHFFKFGSKCFNSDTETGAVILACQWILDNKELK